MQQSSSRYADDAGAPDPRLAAALASYAENATAAAEAQVFAALFDARLLVPVVAELLESELDPASRLQVDKAAEVAQPLFVTATGEHVSVAFTGIESLQRWRRDARPVPVDALTVAREAVARDHAGLSIDPAGPVPFVVDRASLHAIADAMLPVAGSAGLAAGAVSAIVVDQPAAAAPAELVALRAAVAAEPLVSEAWLVSIGAGGQRAAAAIGVLLRASADSTLPVIAHRLLNRLAGRTGSAYDIFALAGPTLHAAREVGVRLTP